jgi:hypothetical protein
MLNAIKAFFPSKYDALLRFIAFATILNVAVTAWSPNHSNQIMQQPSNQEHHYRDPKESSWYDPIVILTIFLVLFNGGLLYVTISLSESTRIAANATKDAVDALPVVERAYVYPVIVSAEAVSYYIRDAIAYGAGDPSKDDAPSDGFVSVDFRLRNYGKTPAILKSVYAGLGMRPIGGEMGLGIAENILGTMESTGILTAATPVGMTPRQARGILSYTRSFCLNGTVEFIDVWGSEYSTRFEFTWDHDIKSMALTNVTTEKSQRRPD